MQRTVFYISDSTGITAETIGNSILAQFEGVQFDKHRLPFIDDAQKAEAAALRIKTRYAQTGERPIVVNTMADRSLCDIVATSGALMMDVFAPFIGPLEDELGANESKAGETASLFNEAATAVPPMGDHERLVMKHLRQDEALQLDALMELLEADLGSGEIFTALFELELAGRVKQMPGKNYVRSF